MLVLGPPQDLLLALLVEPELGHPQLLLLTVSIAYLARGHRCLAKLHGLPVSIASKEAGLRCKGPPSPVSTVLLDIGPLLLEQR